MARPPPRVDTPARAPAGSRRGASRALEAPVHALCCGVDEAGRGPLAGAVFAAAVILDPERPVAGLRDSKTLSALQRERLRGLIVERSLAFSIAQATVEEIDAMNILQASLLAMQRAVAGLGVRPHSALIDGTVCPELPVPSTPVVRGDGKITAIAAASILAKTARDAAMREWHVLYPAYGFDQHMGYGTPGHLQSLARHGACPIHRRSFAPVRAALLAKAP